MNTLEEEIKEKKRHLIDKLYLDFLEFTDRPSSEEYELFHNPETLFGEKDIDEIIDIRRALFFSQWSKVFIKIPEDEFDFKVKRSRALYSIMKNQERLYSFI